MGLTLDCPVFYYLLFVLSDKKLSVSMKINLMRNGIILGIWERLRHIEYSIIATP
jgi:hypothetical protein